MESIHEPVLVHEIVESMAPSHWPPVSDTNGQPAAGSQAYPTYVDGTLGGGGHTKALLASFQGRLNVIAFDRDPAAIERARKELPPLMAPDANLVLENRSFGEMKDVIAASVNGRADLILLDLGISSDELDHSGKGFTFRKEEPLLMTMGNPDAHAFTASSIVNGWEEEDIANVIYAYGEERFARRIARSIILYRAKKQIDTTTELAEIVTMSYPGFMRRGRIHPATKTFQALRIAVNDELGALRTGLAAGYESLAPKGKMAVISFHSLEDRIVKQFFKDKAVHGSTLLTKRPITPTAQEEAENPRSRSAKLRIIQK